MSCPNCGLENLAGTKFCAQCGTSLSVACSQCRFENPPGFAFCGRCGTALAAPVSTSQAVAPEGERRNLTVMFCDLVGSTPLSELLDPEELREVIQAYQHTCAEVIGRFEGYIAQYLGDGLLIYFGYPLAHEDDTQRAVRAGLGILAEWQRTNTQIQKTVTTMQERPVQVRIGIHTGLAVIGEMGGGERRERMAVGETLNIAARIQGLAEPDTLVISSATYQLTQGFFQCLDLGSQVLKGVSNPLSVYRVLGESDVRSRFEVAVSRGLTPLVGREEEVRSLLECWEQGKKGMGQVVLVSGEAGIGKSRLVQELKEQVSREGATWIEFRCSPYHQNSALYPVMEHVQRVVQFEREDSPQVKLEKLEKTLAQYTFLQADTLALLAALLSLPQPEGHPPLSLSPQKQKEKTQESLMGWLVEEAERAAVCCVWEDLQWADPSTLELLSLSLEQTPTTRMFMLLTARPEFLPPWGGRSQLSHLTLSRLGHGQVEEMVEKLTGGKALPVEVVQQIVTKTDGVPLFVEELTKMVVESGLVTEAEGHYELRGPVSTLAIPATLHDSLMARLDRLAPVKEVAQLGATLGREFSYELLAAVCLLDEGTLQEGLNQLVGAELLYRRGIPPQARYLFKHALVQDTAYQSLLKSTRVQYHERIAQVLEKRFAETVETQPELVAYHYTKAGLQEQAIPYWQKAGQRASQRSTNVEAVSHLSHGLELLKTLPDTPEHIQQELSLQIALGMPLIATKGYASPEARQAYARARDLCQQLGDTSQLFPVLYGLFTVYMVAGEHKTAHGLAEQLLSLAHHQQAPTFSLTAHTAFGTGSFYLGELAAAREHFEQGIALYDPQKHNPQVSRDAQDPGVVCRSYAAWALWFLGYPDQALKRVEEALTLARELAHPYSLGFALCFTVRLHQFRREGQQTREQAEAAITLSTDQGFPLFLAWGTLLRGWALAVQASQSGRWGQGEEEIAQIRQGLAGFRATGAELTTTSFLALLAETYGRSEQAGEGLTVVGEALAMANKNEERFYEAELYRLKGELTLQSEAQGPESGVQKQAEEWFHQAIDIARKQSAKSLELRAAMSLSRLWKQQGKGEEAWQMLTDIYGWFTEGFETVDLQEAKMLLEDML